jgi:hypothetical protein
MRFYPGSSVIRGLLVLAVGVAALNLLALAIRFPLLAAVPLGVVAWKKLHRWQVSDAYGNARPSGWADLWHNGLIGGGDDGLIMGTCGYVEPPTRAEGLAALFSPAMPSTLAVRLFLAAFFGKQWMEG